jgi:hypothetical protein
MTESFGQNMGFVQSLKLPHPLQSTRSEPFIGRHLTSIWDGLTRALHVGPEVREQRSNMFHTGIPWQNVVRLRVWSTFTLCPRLKVYVHSRVGRILGL